MSLSTAIRPEPSLPDCTPEPELYTVEGLVRREPALTAGGVRNDLFYRKTNGLEASGALVYRGRKILLNRRGYIDWMISRGTKGANGA